VTKSTIGVTLKNPRSDDDVKFSERCAECLGRLVRATLVPRPLPFSAPPPPRFAADVKFCERRAECRAGSVFETFAPRPLPFVAPSHAHVNTPNTNNRARSVLLFARFVVVVKKFLDAIVVMLDARAFFCLLRPPLCFFVFVFLFFCFSFVFEKESKKNGSRELVSYSSFARDDHTCSKARNEKFVASFGVVFFFRSAPVASRLFLFSFPSSLCLLLLCLLVPLLQPSTAASINNDD